MPWYYRRTPARKIRSYVELAITCAPRQMAACPCPSLRYTGRGEGGSSTLVCLLLGTEFLTLILNFKIKRNRDPIFPFSPGQPLMNKREGTGRIALGALARFVATLFLPPRAMASGNPRRLVTSQGVCGRTGTVFVEVAPYLLPRDDPFCRSSASNEYIDVNSADLRTYMHIMEGRSANEGRDRHKSQMQHLA